MSSLPSTSTASPNEEITSSDVATTSTENSVDQEVRTSNTACCCDFSTRKFASVAYVAFVFIVAVIFLVAANVDTDNHGININRLPVYRYLTVVLFIAILWMATFIVSKCFSNGFRERWFASHIEPEKHLLPTRLLVGVMFFGLGSSFMTMVELLESIAEYNCPRKDLSMLFYYIVRTIFIYTQLYFFYKLSSHSKKVLIFSNFLMMHLIAVNLGTWLVTFVYDSAEELNDGSDEGAHHGNESTVSNSTLLFMARHWGVLLDSHENLTACHKTAGVLKSTAKKMEPYLYTFTMEYCLISAGLLLNAWLSLRTSTETADQNGNENGENTSQNRVDTGYKSQSGDQNGQKDKCGKYKRKGKQGQNRKVQLSSNNIDGGLKSDDTWEVVKAPESMPEVGTLWRFGFILGLVYIPAFTAIVFNMLFTDDEEEDRLIYIGMQFFFFLSIFVASLIGIRQLKKQHVDKTHSQVDFILLAVSLVGVLFLDLLIVVGSICEWSESPAIAVFLIVTNITEVLCSVTFTLFVRKALEHELPAENADNVVTDSASKIREVVSFLFMLNICFWALYTFEVKKSNKVLAIIEQFYTKEVWFYLSHFVYPLAVFFHFHGAVCMVEILNHYSISKSRTIPGSASVSMSMSHPGVQA